MSNSENISLWKKKSEIDYIPIFMSLWLSLNAWLRDKFNEKKDRDLIELLKSGGNKLEDKFRELINGSDNQSTTFKGHLSELNNALENANLEFHKLPENLKNIEPKPIISFKTTILDWRDGNPKIENVVKLKSSKNKIKISCDFYVDENTRYVFRAYIEALYQVRCNLFHGNMPPTKENERVIKALYLTLSMVMQGV